jgi:nicotinic acid mononucleotide adenylyltransferase
MGTVRDRKTTTPKSMSELIGTSQSETWIADIRSTGRKVAIFGTSGNPPTYISGHYGIIDTVLRQGDFSHILILPVYEHIFSKKLIEYHHRMEMCRIACTGMSTDSCKVGVLDLEKIVSEEMGKARPGERVGTVDIVEYLLSQGIDCTVIELHLVLGKDTYRDLMMKKWKRTDRYVLAPI